jgi:hypothetical protein
MIPVHPDFSRAVAAFGFRPEDGGPFRLAATGALINNSRGDGMPFFLTARHSFLFGGSSVRLGPYPSFEAIWDYAGPAAMGGARDEAFASLPRSRGAVLLACDEDTDSALLLLQEAPPDRTSLGWRISEIEERELHRISHPYGYPQASSRHHGLEFLEDAGGSPPCPRRCYRTRFEGTLGPVSSGAPLVTPDLRVVGQLWGVREWGGIDYAVDGAFLHAYPRFRPWLDPAGLGEASAC